MESINQPIFSTFSADGTDDKDELIQEDQLEKASKASSSETPDNRRGEQSPLRSAKGILLAGKNVVTDHNKGLWIIIITTIIFAISITVALVLTIYFIPKEIDGHAAVATDAPKCSAVGLEIIKQGGNAVDAVVAAALCLSVIHPQTSGIGGGGFLLYHDHKNGESKAYDFRETAPANVNEKALTGPDREVSGMAVGIPGQLKGLAEVHKDYGRMKWHQIVQPAITLAEEGFNVTLALQKALQRHLDLKSLPGGAENRILHYYVRDQKFVSYGDLITRPDLADTLRFIASRGADGFYSGKLGVEFVEMVSKYGGNMTLEDLKNYTVSRPDPIISDFKEFRVLGMPAPSSGPVVALMLHMMENFDWQDNSDSFTQTYHQMIETFKFGFAQRNLLGDPSDEEHREAIENATALFLSKDFAASLQKKIDNMTHTSDYYGLDLQAAVDKGTTHLSVVDTNEVMVSMTLTLNAWFGSKLMTSSGIIANNELLDFSFPSGNTSVNERNRLAPGKRPLSSMVPTIAYHKEQPCAKRMILGASNGTRIITGVVETLINTLVFNNNLTYAIARPRIHQQLYPDDTTEYETLSESLPDGGHIRAEFPEDIIQGLRNLGQRMTPASEGLSCVQGIMKINDNIEAYSDWRKYGRAATF